VGEGRTSSNRVSVPDAAAALGVTVDAIRKRIQRDTIAHERDEAGRVWVILDTDQDTASKVQDADQDTTARDELVDELRDQVLFLREELARKDAILLRMAENIPQLEAPPSEAREPRESPSEATPQPGRVEPQPAVQSTQGQESHEMHMPSAGGGPLPRDQQTPSERRWWEFWR
jgi:hypothetical protein